VAVLYSSSISLTASLVDSALDMLSTFIILGTSWAIGAKSDAHLVRLRVCVLEIGGPAAGPRAHEEQLWTGELTSERYVL
jgi:hypothetical protein